MDDNAIPTETEVLILGGGPAGYTAGIRAAQLGLDVTLVEKERVGGTCLNHGCIPSKALISATDVAHRAGSASRMGIEADPSIDLARMIGWKDGIVSRLTGGVEKLCTANGVQLIEGTGKFLDSNRAEVQPTDGDAATIEFEQAVIATGSRPIELPMLPFDVDGVLDARQALSLTEIPDRVAIVGAGYIGMEFAGIFAKLGSTVTVIELLDEILLGYDDGLTRPVERQARRLGIDIQLETGVDGWERDDDGIVILSDSEPILTTDIALVAVGRQPAAESVAPDAAGIERGEAGEILTDDARETSVPGIYAVGDVTGDPMLAHVGMAEGLVAAGAIAGEERTFSPKAIPAVVFTDPEIAQVGLSIEEAEEAGYDPIVGEFPLQASGRAMTVNQTDGLVRVIADRTQEIILGGSVVGPEASEVIGEIGLAVELGASLADVGETMHTHPTISESVMEAAEFARGQAIHRMNK